jgi:hypothetical protein
MGGKRRGNKIAQQQAEKHAAEWSSAMSAHDSARSTNKKRPTDPLGAAGFVGLVNEGATCYLNALLQALYMTPEFRTALFALSPADLRIGEPDSSSSSSSTTSSASSSPSSPSSSSSSTSTSTSSAPAKPKPRTILLQLQRLFARLQRADQCAVSTRDLMASFGWKDAVRTASVPSF